MAVKSHLTLWYRKEKRPKQCSNLGEVPQLVSGRAGGLGGRGV